MRSLRSEDPSLARRACIKVAAIAKDGKSNTVELREEVRGQDPKRLVCAGVGPGGAQLTEGYAAQVWLEEDSENSAAIVVLTGPNARR